MGLYVYFKNWIYNNVLALLFCIQALQSMFIGNFKNGFTLLILLFFYDIFFVFGTDVMLTVAKGINAPIKLMFPKDYSGALQEGHGESLMRKATENAARRKRARAAATSNCTAK